VIVATYRWVITLGPTFQLLARTCPIIGPVLTHPVPVGVGAFLALLPVADPGWKVVLCPDTWISGILPFAG